MSSHVITLFMKDKKITMWWNLPIEEVEEIQNNGELTPFAHIEESEEEENG